MSKELPSIRPAFTWNDFFGKDLENPNWMHEPIQLPYFDKDGNRISEKEYWTNLADEAILAEKVFLVAMMSRPPLEAKSTDSSE